MRSDADGKYVRMIQRGNGVAFKPALERCLKMACGERPERVFASLRDSVTRTGTCGKVWTRGSLAYHCLTCEIDPTAAVCAECFHAADHTGHDYRMVHTSGGCCDCGDPSAWSCAGFCPRHGLKYGEDGAPIYDPPLPPKLRTELVAMLSAVCDRLSLESAAAFQPAQLPAGDVGSSDATVRSQDATGSPGPASAGGSSAAAADAAGTGAAGASASKTGHEPLSRGSRYLITGSQQGNVGMVQRGIETGDAWIDAKDSSEFATTALHWAAQGGYLEIVNLLLANGASVSVTNAYRQTPLQVATFDGHPRVVEALLAAKADPEHQVKRRGQACGQD